MVSCFLFFRRRRVVFLKFFLVFENENKIWGEKKKIVSLGKDLLLCDNLVSQF